MLNRRLPCPSVMAGCSSSYVVYAVHHHVLNYCSTVCSFYVTQVTPSHPSSAMQLSSAMTQTSPHFNVPLYYTMFQCTLAPAEGDDYTNSTFTVTFPSGAQSATFGIPIIDDMIFEGPEEFNLRIIIPQEAADIGVQPGMPIESLVRILDDEGMYVCICTVCILKWKDGLQLSLL